MTAERPESRTNAIANLLPLRILNSQGVHASNLIRVERFFSPLDGAQFSSTILARYDNHDAIAFTGKDGSVILIAEKERFIAAEFQGSSLKREATLAFREDLAPHRIDRRRELEEKDSQEQKPASEETINKSAAEEFSHHAFPKGATFKTIQKISRSEDWLSIELSGNRIITVRADQRTIKGAVLIYHNSVDFLDFDREFDIEALDFKQPLSGEIPARLIIE